MPSEREQQVGADRKLVRVLAYALRDEGRSTFDVLQRNGIELHVAALKASVSFLDFDVIAIFAGAFESVPRRGWSSRGPQLICAAPEDLDLREREFFTAVQRGKTFVFLVPSLVKTVSFTSVTDRIDLFRRWLKKLGIHWEDHDPPISPLTSAVPEFAEFIDRFGTGYVSYNLHRSLQYPVTPLCTLHGGTFGMVVADSVFVLPSVEPQTHDMAVEIVLAAVQGALAYRDRMSKALPAWIEEFRFAKEAELRDELDKQRKRTLELEDTIAGYSDLKGVLALRSDPLGSV